jgi:NlpC/P60 family putative phage cell wall peptidase
MPPRAALVAAARCCVGTPYRHQAALQGVGCDCLGLVRLVWRQVYGPEPFAAPAYTADWAEAARGEPLAEAASRVMTPVAPDHVRPGDLLLFRWRAGLAAKHCAIATGDDPDAVAAPAFVHAHDGAAVAEVAFAPWWRRRLAFAFAFPPLVG